MANSYALGQLGKAFLTATSHEDPEVRRRADRRAQRWTQTIMGMADGSVTVGSRVPVRDLPAWVTLEVLRGGFATGSASAEGALQADEVTIAQRLGIPAARRHIFSYFVTDAGLQELYELLDSGAYRVDIPEDAALLTVAWLVRAGEREAAFDVLDELAPLADRLRLAPKLARVPTSPLDFVYRTTAGEVAASLRDRKEHSQVEVQREALAVWNPFGDRVLQLWLEKYQDGYLDFGGDNAWRANASALIDEYDRLAALHARCTKHRNPKRNLAILIRVMRKVSIDQLPDNREAGLLRCAIEASIAKRGRPGSQAHTTLRADQRALAMAPAHFQLAHVAAARLDSLDPADGIQHPEAFLGEVTQDEEAASGIPHGSAMPPIVRRLLTQAYAAPIETLLKRGLVPSAEVLAALVPRISATVIASGIRDSALARLTAANYRAFRNRRSLLLLNLEKQVQLTELPWVQAVARHSQSTTGEAMAVAQRVGALALDHFPATIIPNPLVQELQHLLSEAGQDVPLVEELAADIFMGRFSDKFLRAAQNAAKVIARTLYARYYAIDTDQILRLSERSSPQRAFRWSWQRKRPTEPSRQEFGALCATRAGRADGARSVAANGTIIEQEQILTTHNLAALVTIGVQPTRPWTDLARDCIHRVAALLKLASQQARPLGTVKDAAYAWRQGVFFLSLARSEEVEALLEEESITQLGPPVMAQLISGLRSAGERSVLATESSDGDHAPFLGWTVGRHSILEATR